MAPSQEFFCFFVFFFHNDLRNVYILVLPWSHGPKRSHRTICVISHNPRILHNIMYEISYGLGHRMNGYVGIT